MYEPTPAPITITAPIPHWTKKSPHRCSSVASTIPATSTTVSPGLTISRSIRCTTENSQGITLGSARRAAAKISG